MRGAGGVIDALVNGLAAPPHDCYDAVTIDWVQKVIAEVHAHSMQLS